MARAVCASRRRVSRCSMRWSPIWRHRQDEGKTDYPSVVPAKAGTHEHRRQCLAKSVVMGSRLRGNDKGKVLEHDPEKACPGLDPGWAPVFGKDHAPSITWRVMGIRRKVITL